MEALTIAVSLAGAGAAFLMGPVFAVAVYFLILFYYPQPLTLSVGTIDFSSSRIVVLGLLAGAFLRGGHLRRFKFDSTDFWILTGFALMTLSFMANEPLGRVIEGRGGQFFDTILPYVAVRLLIEEKKQFYQLVKLLTVGLIPLALMGIMESKTGHNPYSIFSRYYNWGAGGATADPTYMRHGLYRATSSVGNYISFGMIFAGLAPLALGLWHEPRWRKPVSLVVCGGLMVGIVASMSSGPLFSICVSLGMMALFRFRDKWPAFAMMLLACTIFVEAFSNRHFYHVLTLFAFDAETAYYRIGLIEECFGGGMSGHWLLGYGFVGAGPGNNNLKFGWEHKDLTNIYIHILARAGLIALIPYLIVNYLYYKRLYQAAKHAANLSDAWLIWCLAATLVGWNIAMMTVGALAQIETQLYIYIALCVNMPAIMRQGLPGAGPPPEPPVRWPIRLGRRGKLAAAPQDHADFAKKAGKRPAGPLGLRLEEKEWAIP